MMEELEEMSSYKGTRARMELNELQVLMGHLPDGR